MSQHILCIGMSHSTMVTLDHSLWGEWAAQDASLAILFDTDGQVVTYAQLAERAGDRYMQQATPRHWKEQYAAVRRAVARLATDVASAKLDVLVVVGDDQLELFSFANMPSLAIFYGDKISSGLWTSRFATYQRQGQPPSTALSQRLQRAVAEGYAMDAHHECASAPGFARELLASLIDQGFDVAGLGEIPPADESIGLGHAYGAIVTQLMGEQPIPMVPIFVNTYFPPNQPTPSRCYDLGLALHQAIESSPSNLRVGVVASGGLSHFVTDVRLDRQLLAALRAGSEEQLRAIPRKLLNAGSSEIRNWIAVAAASKHLKLVWDEYIPVYRTSAGTGCGLGFACWS
jgi:Catalytic LigB subunit of aromatic ring-opening dioxygenase